MTFTTHLACASPAPSPAAMRRRRISASRRSCEPWPIPLLAVLPAEKRKSWLFTVIRNMRIDAWRKEKRLEQALHSYRDREDRTALEDPLDGELSRWDLQAKISGLSESQQDLIYKRYWLGMSSAQIAEELNLAPTTVRYHLSQAVGRLRETVDQEET